MNSSAEQSDRKRLFLMRLVNFLHGAAGSAITFHVLFLKTHGMSPSVVGTIMALNSLMGAISPPIWGIISDRIRSKYRIFVYTIFGTGIVAILVPISAYISIGGVLLTSAMIPMMNFFRTPSQAILDSTSVTASTMVKGMEYSNVRYWLSIGWTLMCFAYSPLVNLFGVSFPYFGFAFFTVVMFLCSRTLKQYDVAATAENQESKQKLPFSHLFKNYYLMVFLIINILMRVPGNTSQFAAYMLSAVGANTSLVGTISGVRVCGEIVVLLLAPKMRRHVSMPMMFVFSMVCSLAELLTYQCVTSFSGVAFASFLGGSYNGFTLATGYNYVSNLAPSELRTTAISLYTMGTTVAGVIVYFLGGQIVTYQGIRALYLYAAGCMVLWFLLFIGSYPIGERVLKKTPQIPMFRRI